MVKKTHKKKVAINECARSANSHSEREMCYGMNRSNEIEAWYSQSEERKRRERY